MAKNEIYDLRESKQRQWLRAEINDSLRGKVRFEQPVVDIINQNNLGTKPDHWRFINPPADPSNVWNLIRESGDQLLKDPAR